MKKADLMKERAAHIEAQKRLHDAAAKETRSLNEAETAEFRELQGKIEALNEKIADAEAYEENLRSIAEGGEQRGNNPASRSRMTDERSPEEREMQNGLQRYSLHKALRSQLPNAAPLDGIELEYHQEIQKRAAEANISVSGIGIPTAAMRSEKRFGGQSVTQDAGEYGAALVTEQQREIIEFLRPTPVVEKLGARMLRGLQGNLVFPVNEGGIVATWEGEVDEVEATKNKYTKKTMSPKRLVVDVPITLQNLMQSSIDLERYTMSDINAAMAEAIDRAALNGSGTGNVPQGILSASGTNSVAIGTNGGALTWAHIVAAATKVRSANAANLAGAKFGWAINPETSGALQTSPKVSGQAIFLLENDKINGFPHGESTILPNNLTKGTGINLSAAVFGDWNQLLIGEWGFVDVTVDNISKKKEGYIEIVVNGFYDVLTRQPKAFTVIKDIVTA